MNSSSDNGGKSRFIQNIVFASILVLLFVLVCRLFAPFFSALLWSILLYVLLKPFHQRFVAGYDRTTLRGKVWANIWAVVFSLSVVILILVPVSFVVFQLFRQITELVSQVRDYMSTHPVSSHELLEDISRIIRDFSSGQIEISAEDLRTRITGFLSTGLQRLLMFSGSIARNVGGFLTGLVLMVFSLFFFFLDGDYLSRLVLRVIPIRKEYIKALVIKFKEITKRLVFGYILVAMAEAVATFIIFSIFRISGSLVFAALIFFVSFIPIIGPFIIYFPLGLLRIINGNVGNGVLLILISGAFISSIENLVRPIILRDRIQLHPLIIFFAILGGISAFGFNGLILGPMVVILFLTVFDLFLTEYKLE